MKRIIILLIFMSAPVLAQIRAATSIVLSVDSPLSPKLVRLVPLSEDSIPRLLAERKGKVILLNLWATWCGPCVREFPELVRLRNVYFEKGLEVLFVSIDDTNVVESRVKPFLEKQKVTFTSYIKKARDDRRFFTAAGKGFRNAIPTTFVYDRQGNQVQTLVGARGYKTFEELINPLLVFTD